MGLKIQRRMVTKARVITTLIAVFALLVQPGYSFVATQVANAAIVTKVTPGSMNGWFPLDDNGHGGNLSFVSGPGTSPLSSGSAQLSTVSSDQGYMLAKSAYAGLKLSALNQLSYETYVQQGNNIIAPSLQLNITSDVDNNSTWQGRLVYEPYQNGHSSVIDGQWQSQDARGGLWWFSKPALFGNNCAQSAPCALSDIINLYPNAGISKSQPLVGFKAGSNWVAFKGNIDNFVINNDIYDFERLSLPVAAPQTTQVVHQSDFTTTDNTKWTYYNDANNALSAASTAQHAIAALGASAAVKLNGASTDKWTLATAQYSQTGQTKLADVAGIGFDAMTNNTGNAYLNVDVNFHYNGNSLAQGRLVYVPTLTSGSMTSVEAIQNGQGMWQWSNMITNKTTMWPDGSTTTIRSWSDIINAFPNATIDNGYGFGNLYLRSDGTAMTYFDNVYLATVASNVKSNFELPDTQPPTVPINGAPHSKSIPTNEFDFTWDASTDATPGVVKYEFRSSTDQTQVGNAPDTSSAWKSDVLSEPKIHSTGAGDGTWYWQVRSIDAAGNKSAWSSTWNVTLDTKKPTAPTINTPINDQFFASSPITAKWSVSTDLNGSGVKEYQVKYVYDDHHLVNGSDTVIRTTTDTKRNHMPELNEQGGVTVWVQAVDNAGNESGWSSSVHYTYDATAPNVVVTAPAANQRLSGTTLSVSGTATDMNFNYYYCYLTTNATISYKGNTYTPGQEVGVRDARCNTTWTSVTTDGHLGGIDLAGLPDGSYTINVVGYDKAKNNNAANPTRVSFILDNSAPLVSINKPADTTASVPITLTGHVDDAQASLSLWNGTTKIDDITDIDTNGDWKYLLTDGLEQGTTTLRVVATDTLGNESTISTSPDSETTFTVGRFLSSQSGGAGVDAPAPVVLTPPRTLLASNPTSTLLDPPVVLGTQTAKNNVLGASDKIAAIAPSAQGWKIYGVAWYWWVLIITAVAAIMWWIVAAARRRSENA